ncbi:Spx/MgsR family RNA polymerase-binding regulatory protein [uncultured Limnobacter sp.]|uniref:Spx/MgsR family RNA polymerase-binding regulatory protein n=1 Tax=Limnobacter sp. TaxID=2003368 RepID=UPI0030F7E947
MTAKVYGIPNCDSVKKAIASLKSNDIEVVFHDFKKHGVPAQLLDEWIDVLGLEKIINRRGTTWRGLDESLQDKARSPEGAKALLLEYPSIIKRPVVELNGELSIGQTDFSKGNS